MKPSLQREQRVVQTITSIGEGVARSLDQVRVRPRLRDAISQQPFAEVADAVDRHVAELSGVSLGSELLRSVPAFEPATRDAFAQTMLAQMRAGGTKRHEVARLVGMSPDLPVKNISPERLNGLIAHLAGRGELLARSTVTFLHERPSALLEMAPTFGAGVLARLDGGPPVSPFDDPGSLAAPAASRAMPRAGALAAGAVLALSGLWYVIAHQSAPAPVPASLPPVVAPVAMKAPPPLPPPAPPPQTHVLAPRPNPPVQHPVKVHPRPPAHAAKPRHSAALPHARVPKRAPQRIAAAAPAPPVKLPAAAPVQERASVPAANAAPAAVALPTLATSVETDGSSGAGLAAALVTNYLRALINGDEATAYADLGGARGDRGLALVEEEFIDARSRIVSVRAKQLASTSANVEVEMQAAKGLYYATFRIEQGAKGAYIASHDFIKP